MSGQQLVKGAAKLPVFVFEVFATDIKLTERVFRVIRQHRHARQIFGGATIAAFLCEFNQRVPVVLAGIAPANQASAMSSD